MHSIGAPAVEFDDSAPVSLSSRDRLELRRSRSGSTQSSPDPNRFRSQSPSGYEARMATLLDHDARCLRQGPLKVTPVGLPRKGDDRIVTQNDSDIALPSVNRASSIVFGRVLGGKNVGEPRCECAGRQSVCTA